MKKFNELPIKEELLEYVHDQKFVDLTQIQKECIPEILEGKDVVGQAETGSGKTLAFVLPLLHQVYTGGGLQVLVLTPTRELCVQVSDVFKDVGRPIGIRVASIYGGVSIGPQLNSIRKSEVVVGTPGRLLDLSRRKAMKCENFEFLVIDETDKMFEMGFIEDVESIINQISGKRQTLMFSATISKDVQGLMQRHLKNPVVVRTKSQVDKGKLKQTYYEIATEAHKFSLLTHLLKNETDGLAIVFCATRIKTDVVSKNLQQQRIISATIHGGMSQKERLNTLDALKNKKINVLVATDVAARGLDIKNVSHIYNYDVPPSTIDYIHRIGRTARAGEHGVAVTLLTKKDYEKFTRLKHDKEIEIEGLSPPKYEKLFFDRYPKQQEKTSMYNRDNSKWNGKAKGFGQINHSHRKETIEKEGPHRSGIASDGQRFNDNAAGFRGNDDRRSNTQGSTRPYQKRRTSQRSHDTSHRRDSYNQGNRIKTNGFDNYKPHVHKGHQRKPHKTNYEHISTSTSINEKSNGYSSGGSSSSHNSQKNSFKTGRRKPRYIHKRY